ncbi:hypothetical protein EVA_18905 [gut metagenome]|uniref:Uncharacterized protein n=1 Tax=gut metagenome TaxID=749906 RepID=J9FEZ3_9ZZZZ
MRVVRIYPVAKEIIYEFLGKTSDLHIGIHIYVFYLKSISLQHFPDGNDVRMNFSPRQRFHCNIQIISSCTCHLKH